MLDALAEAVTEGVKSKYRLNPRQEGLPRDGWILLDYGDVIVHIFSPERRSYYQLERLWSKGKVLLHLQ